ncbi:hypothetical protein BX666DRAFT_367736 [Dichotomocladium elegans]|nr:hypothetical protein BX666DRAFT_367736 [Dichotomocladium elegans]
MQRNAFIADYSAVVRPQTARQHTTPSQLDIQQPKARNQPQGQLAALMRGKGDDRDYYFDSPRELEHRSSSAPPDQHQMYYPFSDKPATAAAAAAAPARHAVADASSSAANTPVGEGMRFNNRIWDTSPMNVATPLYDSARQAWSSTASHADSKNEQGEEKNIFVYIRNQKSVRTGSINALPLADV